MKTSEDIMNGLLGHDAGGPQASRRILTHARFFTTIILAIGGPYAPLLVLRCSRAEFRDELMTRAFRLIPGDFQALLSRDRSAAGRCSGNTFYGGSYR